VKTASSLRCVNALLGRSSTALAGERGRLVQRRLRNTVGVHAFSSPRTAFLPLFLSPL